MNQVLDQIKDPYSREAEQMRRYSRRVLKRISKRNRKAKDEFMREWEAERREMARME